MTDAKELADELERLNAKATPGEWACWDMDEFDYHIFEAARGKKQDCRKSLMAVRWGRTHEEAPRVPHQRDPGREANYYEMATNAELTCKLRNSTDTIISALRRVAALERGDVGHPSWEALRAMSLEDFAARCRVLADVQPVNSVEARTLRAAAYALAALRVERGKLREELEKANNEFGSQSAEWPNLWERIADLKRLATKRYHALQKANERLGQLHEDGFEP